MKLPTGFKLVVFAAYCLYYVVLIAAAILYRQNNDSAAALVVTVLGLHFLFAACAILAGTASDRYSGRTAVVAVVTDTILTVDMVVASLWLADTISHEWGVFAISAAFAGNAGCLYLHLSE
jgi:hypothetical protein